MTGQKRNYIRESREFSFLVNGKEVDGFTNWDLVASEAIDDKRTGRFSGR